MKKDPTFDEDSLYGSTDWAAHRLGLTKDTFFRKRRELYERDFPAPHPVLGRYLKADVDAWIECQRRIRVTLSGPQPQGINFDGI